MKKLLWSLLFLAFSRNAFPQALHAILVSDVEDAKLGGVSLRDEGKILDILTTAEWGTGLKLKAYYHNRSSFTASAIRETLQKMTVQARDVVFFYYTGLGFYPESNSQFPAFKLKENSLQRLGGRKPPLSLDEVGDILQQKGARLNVVIADCRDTAEKLDEVAGSMLPDEDVRKVFLKKLFLGSCGLVKVASAKKGQKVWANTNSGEYGSVYTELFNGIFGYLLKSDFYGVRQATWPQILNREPIDISFGSEVVDANTRQEPVFEIGTCTALQRRNTTQYPSYQYSMTVGDISWKLIDYKRVGGNYEELRSQISKAFLRNAKIVLIRTNKYPSSDPRAKKVVEQMGVDEFLAQFKKAAPKVVDVQADVTSVRRTPNKEYITALTIIEEFEEL